MIGANKRVLVCHIPGLDSRDISDSTTPAILGLMRRYHSIELRGLPCPDLAPCLLTGTYPHQNGIFQVSLDGPDERSTAQKAVDVLPDSFTVTAQCFAKLVHKHLDLPAIPPRRRRRLALRRISEEERSEHPERMREFNGYPSLLKLLGGNSRYRFTLSYDAIEEFAARAPDASVRFDFFEHHAHDLFQHWNIDNEAGMREALGRTDRWVATLYAKCVQEGHTLVVLSDHGQERTMNTIPMLQRLRRSGVPKDEYTFFCEPPMTRFWFHTDRARETIKPLLENLPNCRLLHYREMHQYNVCFEDETYGEYYVMAEPGSLFFPHDFNQPLGNLYQALFEPSQRSRMFNGVHRGNHSFLPDNPSEKGFMVVADESVRPNREAMNLIDFAPTMLAYFGEEIPEYMDGENVLA